MDGFTYVNIFETKGLEYLAIIAFLLLLIPFWLFLNKKSLRTGKAGRTSGTLSGNMLNIPQGLFYSKNHTWTFLEKAGSARVGLDELLLHFTGEVKLHYFKNPGEMVKKGDTIAGVTRDGKLLRINSPVSGKLLLSNPLLEGRPELLHEDPYGQGWICKIQPTNWVEEIKSYFLAEDAISWSARELVRFRDFLARSMGKYSSELSPVTLQDGGEINSEALSGMPAEIWRDFQTEFLDQIS